ncbi:unnamed protein product [Rotaria sordida]|uniref:Uncharacterized protein n=1 Tax=Rotaria sordida TaxID=392033 RepID=A0A815EKV4_9BILA|nr:unnamed protein product [Rotaria sordida]CAF1578453.1 unnamed protein product [Rotaria sordida]
MFIHLELSFGKFYQDFIFKVKLNLFKIKTKDKIIDIDVNNYLYPLEEQLKELNLSLNNPTVNEMNIIIHLKESKNRPLINSKLKSLQLKSFELIVNILNECWQLNPDLRISFGVIFNRIQSFLSSLYNN